MSTAGNLVFGGTIEGVIFALNATTGSGSGRFAATVRSYGTAIIESWFESRESMSP